MKTYPSSHNTQNANPSRNQTRLTEAQERVITTALAEDLGITAAEVSTAKNGSLLHLDLTTAATIPPNTLTEAVLIVKEPGVLAGLNMALSVFKMVDANTSWLIKEEEGNHIDQPPTTVATLQGKASAIMLAERTALNILQRLSGIATVTAACVTQANEFGIKILDTRKTTPGLRALEKYAVETGGGTNHRYGLFDAILIKDNHIRLAGGITAAITKSRQAFPQLKIEVEVSNLDELAEALALQVEHIMLDNMTPDEVGSAISLINGRSYVEVSGGVNAHNIHRYLIKGVDAISMGALTHSVASLDISLEIEG